MKRTKLLQEVRKMRFEQAYDGWREGRLILISVINRINYPGPCTDIADAVSLALEGADRLAQMLLDLLNEKILLLTALVFGGITDVAIPMV